MKAFLLFCWEFLRDRVWFGIWDRLRPPVNNIPYAGLPSLNPDQLREQLRWVRKNQDQAKKISEYNYRVYKRSGSR